MLSSLAWLRKSSAYIAVLWESLLAIQPVAYGVRASLNTVREDEGQHRVIRSCSLSRSPMSPTLFRSLIFLSVVGFRQLLCFPAYHKTGPPVNERSGFDLHEVRRVGLHQAPSKLAKCCWAPRGFLCLEGDHASTGQDHSPVKYGVTWTQGGKKKKPKLVPKIGRAN